MVQALIKKHYVQSTSKGQVTLPVSIRRKLGIDPNTLLSVMIDHGRVVFEPVASEPVKTERWETVIDFTQFAPHGVAIAELQRELRPWTKSKKR